MGLQNSNQKGNKKVVYIKGLDVGDPKFLLAEDETAKFNQIKGRFVSVEKGIYNSETYGEKTQMRLTLEDEGVVYQVRANMTSLARSIVNCLCSSSQIGEITITLRGGTVIKDGKQHFDNKAYVNDEKGDLLKWKFDRKADIEPLIEREETRKGLNIYYDKVDDMLLEAASKILPIEFEDKKFGEDDPVITTNKPVITTPVDPKEKAKQVMQGNVPAISDLQKGQIEKLMEIRGLNRFDMANALKKMNLKQQIYDLNSSEAFKVIEYLVSGIVGSSIRLSLDDEKQAFVQDLWDHPQDTGILAEDIAQAERRIGIGIDNNPFSDDEYPI